MSVVTVLTRHPKTGSGAELARSLNAVGIQCRTASPNSRRSCRGNRVIINYGVSAHPVNFRQGSITWSNEPSTVGLCALKSNTMRRLENEYVPTLESVAIFDPFVGRVRRWLEEDGKIVVRHVLSGHSGQGLQIVRTGEDIPEAPLYTRYFRKDAEYRVHVAFGNVILIQQKRKENGREQTPIEKLVRTHANGWVFTINDLQCDQLGYRALLCDLGLRAAAAVGANHCGVDILVRHSDPVSMVVCEINSACGLRSEFSLSAYTTAFVNWINSL